MKIIIIGNMGSGNSAFAKKIRDITKLPQSKVIVTKNIKKKQVLLFYKS